MNVIMYKNNQLLVSNGNYSKLNGKWYCINNYSENFLFDKNGDGKIYICLLGLNDNANENYLELMKNLSVTFKDKDFLSPLLQSMKENIDSLIIDIETLKVFKYCNSVKKYTEFLDKITDVGYLAVGYKREIITGALSVEGTYVVDVYKKFYRNYTHVSNIFSVFELNDFLTYKRYNLEENDV